MSLNVSPLHEITINAQENNMYTQFIVTKAVQHYLLYKLIHFSQVPFNPIS